MDLFLLLLALLGHAFFWIGLVNRLHALGIRRRIVDLLTAAFFLCAATIPIAVGVWLYETSLERPTTASWGLPADGGVARNAYRRLRGRLLGRRGDDAPSLRVVLVSASNAAAGPLSRKRRATIDLKSAAVGAEENTHHFLARLPLNEILRLDVSDWTHRRAAARPGARRPVDRSSFRLPLHRPRGQGVFPRGRPHEQRASARPGGPDGRPGRLAGVPRLDSRHAGPAHRTARRLFRSRQPRPAAPAMSLGCGACSNKAGWSIWAAERGKSRSTASPSC